MTVYDLHVEAQNIEMQPEWKDRISEEFVRMQQHCRQILHGRVEIIGSRHHRHGTYEVRVVVSVPHDTLVVSRVGDLEFPLLTQCFDSMQRQLDAYSRRAQGDARPHVRHVASGRVCNLHRMEGFGFIRSSEPGALDVYFHQHAFKDGNFFALRPGERVRFVDEEGDRGPQAVWVRTVH